MIKPVSFKSIKIRQDIKARLKRNVFTLHSKLSIFPSPLRSVQ